MACRQCIGIEAQFNDRVARRELRKYRRSGPRKTTRILLDFIRQSGVSRGSLLDVGGGIGAIQHELADAGADAITSIDASSAYLATAKAEGERRGYADRADYLRGDFIDLASEAPSADLVTMDRVICCYPHVEALLQSGAAKSKRAIGLVFPREDAYIRIGSRLANWALRLFGSDFRAFVHPHEQVERILNQAGFKLAEDTRDLIWRVSLFTKTNKPTNR